MASKNNLLFDPLNLAEPFDAVPRGANLASLPGRESCAWNHRMNRDKVHITWRFRALRRTDWSLAL
jgi:hypothetical protein